MRNFRNRNFDNLTKVTQQIWDDRAKIESHHLISLSTPVLWATIALIEGIIHLAPVCHLSQSHVACNFYLLEWVYTAHFYCLTLYAQKWKDSHKPICRWCEFCAFSFQCQYIYYASYVAFWNDAKNTLHGHQWHGQCWFSSTLGQKVCMIKTIILKGHLR